MNRFLRRRIRTFASKLVRAHPPSRFETLRPFRPDVGLVRDHWVDPRQRGVVDPRFRALLDDPDVRAAVESDSVPLPAGDDREGYFGDRHLSYWLSGHVDLGVVRGAIPAANWRSVLDFGGANGRFARHVVLAAPDASVTIAELDVNHVAWVDRHFGPRVRAIKVSPYPHLPLADASVTLCVGFSVFTHIDSYESGWIAEIHRVLAPGGHAFLTIHSEHTWPLLAERPDLLAKLSVDPRFGATYRADAPMPAERIVFVTDAYSIEHNCDTFFHSDYVRRCWGRWFDVLAILPRAHHAFQTAVVLRKGS